MVSTADAFSSCVPAHTLTRLHALPSPTDSRRQTGPGRLLDAPGAAMEVAVTDDARDAALAAWTRHVRALAGALGWPPTPTGHRAFDGGLSLGVASPADRLYTATELNEAAWTLATDPAADGAALLADLRRVDAREATPALAALLAAAQARDVPCLWDDEAVTLGLGARSRTVPADALPAPDDVDWSAVGAVPVALVTGTNGKSTTVRLTAAVARAAGHTPGVSTTDYVAVGDEIVEAGDFSGPMGARAALRDRRATCGVLEVARGGLLRRGVPLTGATAAAVTNVAADHLGDYGVRTVEALAEAKFVVAKGVADGGTLVLNADDPLVAAEADRQASALARLRLAWTSLDPDHPRRPLAAVVDGHLALRDAADAPWRRIVAVADVPCTLGGTARHNTRNALTACALGAVLGVPDDALARGLVAFAERDNPGRINRFRLPSGARVVVDYAHNAHGIAAILDTVGTWPAGHRRLLMSVGGDRSDADMAAMSTAALTFGADRYLLPDLPGYERGRATGEGPLVFRRALVAAGVDESACDVFPHPAAATAAALDGLPPDGLALLFVLTQRDEVFALLTAAGAVAEG